MNGEKQELLLLQNIVLELQHIKQAIQNGNAHLNAIDASTMATQANTAAIAEILVQTNVKLDQIIQNTTPPKSTDVASFTVSADAPTKQ